MIRLFQNLFGTSYNSESKDLEQLQVDITVITTWLAILEIQKVIIIS